MKETRSTKVEIEFDLWGTDLVRGRQWHSSQELTDLPNGGSRLKMRLSSLEEIERWVLGWGSHAKVIGPAALRGGVTMAAKVAAIYGGADKEAVPRETLIQNQRCRRGAAA